MMTGPAELRRLLEQPEGEQLEFKRDFPSKEILLRLISAFANTSGGVIVVGFDERLRRPVGVAHPGGLLGRINEWVRDIEPPPKVEAEVVRRETGEDLLLIRVAPGHAVPHLAQGQAVERRGDRVAPISRERILSGAPPALADSEAFRHLASTIAEQSQVMAQQSEELRELTRRLHWRRQLPTRLAGSAGGAIVGYVLGVWAPL